MFYDTASSSNFPTLYICWAKNVLGRVPLMLCFVGGAKTQTLPHSFGGCQGAVADSSKEILYNMIYKTVI